MLGKGPYVLVASTADEDLTRLHPVVVVRPGHGLRLRYVNGGQVMDRGRPRPYTVKAGRPYALQAGQGWTYNQGGVPFTVKAGELGRGRRLAVVEYTTRRGEEPPDHTHATEDEIFYVLEGAVGFRCGDEWFEVTDGGFVFLPRGIEHGYTIRSDPAVRARSTAELTRFLNQVFGNAATQPAD